MSEKTLGQELIDGLQEIIKHEKGLVTLRTKNVLRPNKPSSITAEELKNLRENVLLLSQAMFAEYCGVGVETVRKWEQGKLPKGAALRLINIAQKDPEKFKELVIQTAS